MEIKRVAIYGAGGIGAYLIEGLSNLLGENLVVVAEGDRKDRLEKDGLIINDKEYKLNVVTPEEAGAVDFLVVSVKYNGLRGILPGVKTIVENAGQGDSEKPIVMSLMNGIDSEEILAEVVPDNRILPSIIRISAERTGNNTFIHYVKPGMGIHLGTRRDGTGEDQVEAVTQLLSKTELDYTVDEDLYQMMWYKFGVNNAENLAQAVLNVGLGFYKESEHGRWFRHQIWEEVRLVAKAEGIELPEEPGYYTPHPYPNYTAYSTLQDVRAKRETEVEMFAGGLMRVAAKHGLKVPVSETTYHYLKAVDEKNAGKFDWEQD